MSPPTPSRSASPDHEYVLAGFRGERERGLLTQKPPPANLYQDCRTAVNKGLTILVSCATMNRLYERL